MFTLLANSTIDIRAGLEQYSVQPVETSLTPILADIINGVVLIAALAFLLYLLLGAIQWVTSGGDKGKVEQAQQKITQSLIGLGVAVFAYTLYLFVINYFGIALGQGSGGAAGGGNGGGNGTSICTPGQTGTFTGGYCTSGAARMRCFGPGQGVSQYTYNHWEPCSCVNGTGAQNSSYDFSSC